MLPGVIGTIQANEALKILVGYGEPLVGRLLMFDAQATTFSELKLRRDPACSTCGSGASTTPVLRPAEAKQQAPAPSTNGANGAAVPEPAAAGRTSC